ncbi:MAG: primase-helicase family protein [Phycisphaerales bacterium JB052]
MNRSLLVFPRRNVAGWHGHLDELERIEVFALKDHDEEPWEEVYDGDAHCVAYTIPGEETMPRLNKPSYMAVKDQGKTIQLSWMIVDIDNPGHAEWTDELYEETFRALARLPEFGHCGWYLTRGGLRLVWPLKEPISVACAEDFKAMFHDHLREHGIVPDDLFDWTRLYRMPRVVRDGVRQDYPLDFEHMAPLEWTPPREPIEGTFSRVVMARPEGGRPEMPEGDKVRRGDYAKLKDHDFYHRIVDGLPLAPSGRRNQAMVQVIGTIIAVYDTADPYFVYRLMKRSIEAQVKQGSKWGLDHLWDRCCYFTSLHAGLKETEEELRKAFRKIARSLQDKAAECIGIGVDELQHHLIISCRNTYYIFNEHKMCYDAPCSRIEILRGLRRSCPALCPTTTSHTGANLADVELLARYSTPAHDVYAVLGQEGHHYNAATGAMYEGCAAVRPDLKPVYNAQIQRWLELLGGERKDAFLDWLATLLILDKPTCAIYLHGPNSIGKGMLGEGLARLWGGALTSYSTLSASFNERLTKCPLIVADEAIPSGIYDTNASAIFRQLLGSSQMPLKRKWQAEASLMGCPRLLITANNADALRVREDLTVEDLDAIIRRVGYIKCNNDARDFLEELGGRDTTESWVAGDGIAQHILWLHENRQVDPGPRYVVEGWESELTHDLVTYAGFNGQVLVALVYFITEHQQNTNIIVGDGRLLVNARALLKEWKALLGPDARIPEEYRLTDALRAVSHDKVRARNRRNRHVRCWDIDLERLYRIAERQNLADREELEKHINEPTLKEIVNS